MSRLSDGLPNDVGRALSQVGLGLFLSGAAYALTTSHIRSLFTFFFTRPGKDGWTLDFALSDMGWVDRAFLLVCGVVYKAVRGLFVPGLKVKGRETVELPRLEVRCPVELEESHTKLYSQALAVGTQGKTEVKAKGRAEEFLLAALTNQMMLLLVVHPQLPVSPLGGVNVRNRIEFHSPLQQHSHGSLTAHARVGGKDNLARVVKRGLEFDIHVAVYDAQTLVLRQIITVLTPCKTSVTSSSSTTAQIPDADSTNIGQIIMPSSAPSPWCKLCGDFNPVHVSSTLARLFGFSGKIAHGNHVVAKVLQALDVAESSSSSGSSAGKGKGWCIEMQFQRPMVLPIKLAAQVEKVDVEGKQQWRCARDDRDGKVYVSGSIGPL